MENQCFDKNELDIIFFLTKGEKEVFVVAVKILKFFDKLIEIQKLSPKGANIF